MGWPSRIHKALKEYLHGWRRPRNETTSNWGLSSSFSARYEEIGAGMIVWHPKGAMLRHILEDFEIKEHLRRGYEHGEGPRDPADGTVESDPAISTITGRTCTLRRLMSSPTASSP